MTINVFELLYTLSRTLPHTIHPYFRRPRYAIQLARYV